MKKTLTTTVCALALAAFTFSMYAGAGIIGSAAPNTNSTGDNIQIQSIDFSGADVELVPQSGATLNSLIDGVKGENIDTFASEGVVLFKNKKATSAGVYTEFSLTLKLQEASSVGGAVVTFYKEYNSMIGLPKDNSIKVEYSNDGSAFLPVGNYTFEGEAAAETNELQDASVTFNGVVNASFIRLTFAYGDSPFTTDDKVVWEWIGMTEVALTGAPTTSNPDTSDNSGDNSQTPGTGEQPLWISLTAAAIAAGGIAVAVIRLRKKA